MTISTCMLTNMYPTAEHPAYGAFIKSQIDSIVAAGHTAQVLFIDGRASKWNYISAVGELRRRVKRERIDLIHAHYGLSGMVACAQRSCPVVLSFCGDDLLGTSDGNGGITPMSRAIVWVDQFVARSVDRIIVKSQKMLETLKYQDARDKAVIIPNGVDFDVFAPTDKMASRQQLKLRPDGHYILFPSTPLAAVKRIDLARDAVKTANGKWPGAELIVLHGEPQEKVPLYMSACDAMLLTSDSEGSPNVVKEAMACNLPVIAVDAGDAWDVIRDAKNCHRAERRADDLASKIDQVLAVGERSNGRDCIKHLELHAVAKRVIDVYQSVLSEPR